MPGSAPVSGSARVQSQEAQPTWVADFQISWVNVGALFCRSYQSLGFQLGKEDLRHYLQ